MSSKQAPVPATPVASTTPATTTVATQAPPAAPTSSQKYSAAQKSTASIVAFPSVRNKMFQLPNMTNINPDLVHYGAFRDKDSHPESHKMLETAFKLNNNRAAAGASATQSNSVHTPTAPKDGGA